MLGYSLAALSNVTCAIGTFFYWITSYTSVYLMVLFSLDKCLAVVFPFKYKQYGKPIICKIATATIYMVQTFYAIPVLFVVRKHPTVQICFPADFSRLSRRYFLEVVPVMNTFWNGLVPILLVAVFASVTIVKCQRPNRDEPFKQTLAFQNKQIVVKRSKFKQKGETIDKQRTEQIKTFNF